jgi:hypothetical protein
MKIFRKESAGCAGLFAGLWHICDEFIQEGHMKSRGPCGVTVRSAVILLSISAAAQAQNFVWQRAADWVPGSTAGGTINNPGPGAGSASIWQYEFTQGGPLGSTNPWYSQGTTMMVWDPGWWNTGWGVWSKGDNVNPPVMSGRLVHNVHASTFADVPIVRWNNPFGTVNDLGISGSLLVNWNGMNGAGHPVDVDVIIAKQNAQRTATTLLFSTTVAKPNPFVSVGDSVSIPLNLSNISLLNGESIIISHRGRSSLQPSGGWINLYDNVTFTAIPAPGSLGLLGIAGLALARRRRS